MLDFGLGRFIVTLAIVAAIVGIILWNIGMYLVRHIRVEWVS